MLEKNSHLSSKVIIMIVRDSCNARIRLTFSSFIHKWVNIFCFLTCLGCYWLSFISLLNISSWFYFSLIVSSAVDKYFFSFYSICIVYLNSTSKTKVNEEWQALPILFFYFFSHSLFILKRKLLFSRIHIFLFPYDNNIALLLIGQQFSLSSYLCLFSFQISFRRLLLY